MRSLNVVVVTTRLFSRPSNGGELCTARMIASLLRAGHRVRVIGRGDALASMGAEAGSLQVQAVADIVTPFAELGAWQRARSLIGALWRRQSWTLYRLASPGVPAKVSAQLREWHDWPIDVLLVDHLQALSWLAADAPSLPGMVVVMHNLEASGHIEQARRAAEQGRWLAAAAHRRESRFVLRLEERVLERAAAVACLSPADAEAWRARAREAGRDVTVEVMAGHGTPAGPVSVVQHAFMVKMQSPAGTTGRRRIGLVGTWTWGPNREGLDWLLREVVPRLDAHCQVVLAGPGSRQIMVPPAVQVLGWVDDLMGFYASLDVVALPSHSGSGVHEKAIEALGLARMVVATPHALRGLGLPLPPHVKVAADARTFARLCNEGSVDARSRREGAAWVAQWNASRMRSHDIALERCLTAATQVLSPEAERQPPLAA